MQSSSGLWWPRTRKCLRGSDGLDDVGDDPVLLPDSVDGQLFGTRRDAAGMAHTTLVPSLLLGPVEGGIRRGAQSARGPWRARVGGHAHARGHAGEWPLHVLEDLQARHLGTARRHELRCFRGTHVRQDDDELVPAVARNDVRVLRAVERNTAAAELDGLVALLVSVQLVDLPEMVEVHHDEGERLVLLPRLRHVAAQRILQEAPVVHAGELVGDGPLARAFPPEHHLGDELRWCPAGAGW